jgi:hypothetical protein
VACAARAPRRCGRGDGDTLAFDETPDTDQDNRNEERIEALTELVCRACDEPRTKTAALLLLMSTLEVSSHPKALANSVKHLAFAHCGEINLFGNVDAQIAVFERELLATDHRL